MITIAIPSSRCRRSSSARICAWTVTSSAVVGSSAISSLRLVGERHRDHRALAHAAGELVRVVVDAPGRVGDPDEPEQLDRALARLRLGDVLVGEHRLDQLRARPCRADAAPTAGPGRSSRSRCRGSRAAALRGASTRSWPSNRIRPEMLAPWRRVRPSVVSEETVLPEPDSPTIPSVRPRSHLVGDPVDGVHDAVFAGELDAQILDAQQRRRRGAHE